MGSVLLPYNRTCSEEMMGGGHNKLYGVRGGYSDVIWKDNAIVIKWVSSVEYATTKIKQYKQEEENDEHNSEEH